MLAGKKILLGITGSIAAYKTPILVRLLIKNGAEVKVVMTSSAADLVSKLTLSTLSRNEVLVDLFNEKAWANHVMLGRWADVMLIAPLTANTLGKMANGLCENLLLATYFSANSPVVVAPAMDEDMWKHPVVKRNLSTIQQSCSVIPVQYGELASGLTGEGRMSEPEEILAYLQNFFSVKDQLKGKKALVTAGPTYEAIDPVRFIGNHSSGKMGYAIADELKRRGADVTLISGPVDISPESSELNVIKVTTAEEMYQQCVRISYDIAVLAAAVSDYKPETAYSSKLKKTSEDLHIKLVKTKDILSTLGESKTKEQLLVGFALETNDEKENALKKLKEKNADMIVLNSLNDKGAGFQADTNKVSLFYKTGEEKTFELKSKTLVAKDIVDSIISIL
ncbi:MAG: bifunctional phosphopantothenoylcysteine decarboxylase/phosphopantothenate--cysteine ligase CoaBC [Candidatus Dadabacteria bacterium]